MKESIGAIALAIKTASAIAPFCALKQTIKMLVTKASYNKCELKILA